MAPPLALHAKQNKNSMMTALLVAAGLIGFAIFFKSIDWFEKI
jgi:hypothetical protein